MTADVQLFHAARSGDPVSLGRLLENHRPALLAAAVHILGYKPQAEDAVSETILTALVKLDQVRDPQAFGGWLRATLRNTCLMQLRTAQRETGLPAEEANGVLDEALREDTMELRIEQALQRDWLWNALRSLSEPLRAAVILRHFSTHSSYEAIADTLGIPVGTVRSRLAEARKQLTVLLRNTTETVDSETQVLTARRDEYYRAQWHELYRGGKERFLNDYTSDVLYGEGVKVQLRGRESLARVIDEDLEAGSVLHIERILASGTLTIVEGRFTNPPEHADRCPPRTCAVMFHTSQNEQVRRLQLYHADRKSSPVN